MATFEEFMQGIADLEAKKAAYLQLADADMSKEMAIVQLVNRCKITYGAASDVIELCEVMTGRKLRD